MQHLLTSDDAKPMISHLKNEGWLLSVYVPIRNSAGSPVSYVGTYINMEQVVASDGQVLGEFVEHGNMVLLGSKGQFVYGFFCHVADVDGLFGEEVVRLFQLVDEGHVVDEVGQPEGLAVAALQKVVPLFFVHRFVAQQDF